MIIFKILTGNAENYHTKVEIKVSCKYKEQLKKDFDVDFNEDLSILNGYTQGYLLNIIKYLIIRYLDKLSYDPYNAYLLNIYYQLYFQSKSDKHFYKIEIIAE